MIASKTIAAVIGFLSFGTMLWGALDDRPCGDYEFAIAQPVVAVGEELRLRVFDGEHPKGCTVRIAYQVRDHDGLSVIRNEGTFLSAGMTTIPIDTGHDGRATVTVVVSPLRNRVQAVLYSWFDWAADRQTLTLPFVIKRGSTDG